MARRAAAGSDFATRWRAAGADLAKHRRQELRALDARAARVITRDLFSLWTPDLRGDDGASLIRTQRTFRRLRARRR